MMPYSQNNPYSYKVFLICLGKEQHILILQQNFTTLSMTTSAASEYTAHYLVVGLYWLMLLTITNAARNIVFKRLMTSADEDNIVS